ncbi:unnamed protein product [Leptidea sinapis]|uniref:Uncharacterized protein n=1 Tax=Leptidea sinapis TaxID=189913 RepID=A0A5E4R3D7_9NEOP|nr:unnamed protein product [Leptidea sinapis]
MEIRVSATAATAVRLRRTPRPPGARS